jgi:YfiH family protein
MTGKGFVLREFQGLLYYSCGAFESLPWLRHGFSTRHGGPSGDPERFLFALGLEDAHLVTLRQVHSSRVHVVENVPGQWPQTEGDALATRIEEAALAVRVADCFPVLIADPRNRAVAAVHSGWRGTLSRVLLQTIVEMGRAFDSRPEQLLVAIGPGIRECCFEVGSEVERLFEDGYPGNSLATPISGRPGKYFLDLSRALAMQLKDAGVRAENCHDLGLCTCCNRRDFFSYRAEGAGSGRMLAVICRKTGA